MVRVGRKFGFQLGVSVLLVSFIVTGCLDRELKPLKPCTVSAFVRNIRQNKIEKVDILFMVDNSLSMQEEQNALGVQLRNMVLLLVTGDSDGDGTQDFPPVKDLRLGVVSPDLGAGGNADPNLSCQDDPDQGDDAVMRTMYVSRSPELAGCPGVTTPVDAPFLSYMTPADGVPNMAETDQLADRFRCIAQLGADGCAYEQQLEASLKALYRSDQTPPGGPFVSGSPTGQGYPAGANKAFYRQDSLLVIILITDEEDCSTTNPVLYTNQNPDTYLDRCCHPDKSDGWKCKPQLLQPISRYVDGFKAMRPGADDLVVFAAITGVPKELVQNPDNVDYNAILNHPKMELKVRLNAMGQPATQNHLLEFACESAGLGSADPARRIVQVAQEFGENGIIQSICQEDFRPALTAIISKIGDVLNNVCLPNPLNTDPEGRVPCDVIETLPPKNGEFDPDVTECSRIPGRTLARKIGSGTNEQEVCRVEQIVRPQNTTCNASSGANCGWYYDSPADECPEDRPQRIAFTMGAEPRQLAQIRLECLQPAQGGGGDIVVGTPCRGQASLCGQTQVDELKGKLFCEEISGTCQQMCNTDVDCGGGLVCDTEASPAMCINPTCGG